MSTLQQFHPPCSVFFIYYLTNKKIGGYVGSQKVNPGGEQHLNYKAPPGRHVIKQTLGDCAYGGLYLATAN